jgi:transglutaminase-like putative cysteine protease
MSAASHRLPWTRKVAIALRVWSRLLSVSIGLRRYPLPELIARLDRGNAGRPLPFSPPRLGRMVTASLRLGPYRPRCLHASLVLYGLLRQSGVGANLVIGLPHEARSKDAHAWVEVDGVDVGPAPGGAGHLALARYG